MTDPVEFFGSVTASHRRCVWLDGGGAREWSGRRSIIGWLEESDPSLSYDRATGTVTRYADGVAEVVGGDPFVALEREMSPGEQWFGYFGYAARPDLPARPDSAAGGAGLPDAVWLRPSHVRFFEHAAAPAGTSYGGWNPHHDSYDVPRAGAAPDWYAEGFRAVQEALHAGDSYEVNLTHRVRTHGPADPVQVYLRLRALNPAPYAGFLQHDVDGAPAWLLSSSPERYALVDADRRLVAKPIKGTTPRGVTPEEDEELRAHLASDPKFRAENLMVVDLLRNDLSMVCEPGTVEVPELMAVESYATVHQLVSTVAGRLRDDVSTVAAMRALFPAGSMTGAPKLRTMEVIDRVETTPRGAYAGAFGWISGDGQADLGVVIRSLTTSGAGDWTLGTGGAITVRSDVEEEYAESRWKSTRLRRALDGTITP